MEGVNRSQELELQPYTSMSPEKSSLNVNFVCRVCPGDPDDHGDKNKMTRATMSMMTMGLGLGLGNTAAF